MARPREFDPEEALSRAMEQFRAHGYHDTSIRDLARETRVGPYGLYGTFNGKQGLLLASLDLYRRTVTAEIVEVLQAPGPLTDAIRKTLDRVLALMKTPDGRVGCLMAITAVELAPQDPEVATRVEGHMAMLRDAFERRIEVAIAACEIGDDLDARALAEFFASTVYAIGLLVRAGRDDAFVRRHIDTTLRVLG